MTIYAGRDGLYDGDRHIPIYSGTVHYWRLAPELWEPILQNVRELGFEMIETYIPWAVHEVSRGDFDFGERDPYKDLPRFLDICHQLGISVCVRPGPHINAELTFFGFPERILQDPDVYALTATGAPAITDRLPQPFPVPSYASEKLFAESEIFFKALCPVLIPYLAPNGPIVACQVDNETCYFFRGQAYDMDYSADSLKLYRKTLKEKYGSVEALSKAYGQQYTSFDAVEPPRDFEAESKREVPRLLDWAAYKEHQLTASLERIGTMLRDNGITVPLYHDVAFHVATPIDVNTMQAQPHLDFVGTNLYANREEYHSVIAPRIRYQVGTETLPFVPEYGSGLWWFHPRTHIPSEQEFFVMTGLMHGIRALNFYMLVERDRWQGSPITRDNRLRAGYADFFKELSTFVKETSVLRTDKFCKVLVAQNYDLNRYTLAATTLNDAYLGFIGVPFSLNSVESQLDYSVDPAKVGSILNPDSWIRGVMGSLEASQIEYDLSDTHSPPETFARYALVFVPTADFMDTAEQERLLAYACNGGHLVIGPSVPSLDPLMRSASVLSKYIQSAGTVSAGEGKITLLPDAKSLTQSSDPALAQRLTNAVNPIRHNNAVLRLTVRDRLCFVANPTDTEQEVTLESAVPLRGVWNIDGMYRGSHTIPPYTVQVWEIQQ